MHTYIHGDKIEGVLLGNAAATDSLILSLEQVMGETKFEPEEKNIFGNGEITCCRKNFGLFEELRSVHPLRKSSESVGLLVEVSFTPSEKVPQTSNSRERF